MGSLSSYCWLLVPSFHLMTYGMHPELHCRDPMYIFVVRNSRLVPSGVHPFWKSLFQFAHTRGGGNLDDLMHQWY